MYDLAMISEKLKHFERMETLLRKVMELNPEDPNAYNALGYSLAERNIRLPEARVLLEKALSLRPADPFITDSLAWLEYRSAARMTPSNSCVKPWPPNPIPKLPPTWAKPCGPADNKKRRAKF